MITQTGYQAYTAMTRDAVRTAGQSAGAPARQKAADRLDSLATTQDSSGRAANADAPKAEFGFFDFIKTIIDVVNPLQHIPVVSTIYRNLTSDEINPAARIIGDTIYGGPVGTAVALADVVTQDITGKDIGQNMLAMVTKPGKNDDSVQVASAAPRLNDPGAPRLNDPGAPRLNDIIWNDDAPAVAVAANSTEIHASPAGGTPTPQPARTGAGITTFGSHPSRQAPSQLLPDVSGKKRIADVATAATTNGILTERTGKDGRTAALSPVDPTRFLQTQDAPAGEDRISSPPELIAQKMADALDRYRALKSAGIAPAAGGLDRPAAVGGLDRIF